MKKETTKQLTKPFLYPIAIGIIIWEELAYKPIKKITNFLEKNQVIHKLSDKIRNANPYVALGILCASGLPLLPFKFAGLWLIKNGHPILGAETFILAKIVGSGFGLHLFNLTEPAIRKIGWVNTSLDFIFDKKDKIKKVLTESRAYIATKKVIHDVKENIKEYLHNSPQFNSIKRMFTKKIKSNIENNNKEQSQEQSIGNRIVYKVENFSHNISNFIHEDISPQMATEPNFKEKDLNIVAKRNNV